MKTTPSSYEATPPLTQAVGTVLSQPVTPKDLGAGRVRITSRSGGKKLLPAEKARVSIVLRGRVVPDVRWDPMMGPDRERSGTLGIGKDALNELVAADERLVLGRLAAGHFSLD